MRILHYTLGMPPARTGGLVNYVLDLANEQSKIGHEILLMYPGKLKLLKKTHIKQKFINGNSNIKFFEIINSLPLALFGGISDPIKFMETCDNEIYRKFLKENKPDVIHVHTIMGIHKEFFFEAKKLNVPIIFTTHDYYGLAPEPNFYFDGLEYSNENTVENWIRASNKAFSVKKLRVFQFKYYSMIRKIVKKCAFFKVHNEKKIVDIGISSTLKMKQNYKALKNYYMDIFSLISFYHFNSTIAADIYRGNLKSENLKGEIISITNSNIKHVHIFNHKEKLKDRKIKIGYIGPYKEYKGFNDFIYLAQDINDSKYEFHIFGDDKMIEFQNVINHGRYQPSLLDKVYDEIDILIVPSQWKETFGLVVLEALHFNKMVFVSQNVGAQDVLSEEFIFNSMEDLKVKLQNLQDVKEKINTNYPLKTIKEHCLEIINLYERIIK
ncbi:glycosyltransferase [Vagococcus lutrae]|uniref:glycosyltransferase n=1 Tax=Vagococcus lutrae TaxID=81947 RepID=UPI002890BB02|nr:glycosyltransferase [Vagococcus lutrae]MDT2842083.1 glycosyltransferase [Vagococcus lutrae]